METEKIKVPLETEKRKEETGQPMSLIEKITDESNIYLAIESIKKNKGSKTPGVDGKTIKYIVANRSRIVERIKIELSGNTYQPQQIRRVEIPKSKGKTRPLGIPVIYDRVVQQCFKQIIEPLLDKKFHHYSFGFRPQRSTENAIATTYHMINIAKLHFVVDIDIKGFFDNINHNKLIKQLIKFKSLDQKVISLIKCMLKAETLLPNGEIEFTGKGTPQGGILSPLLANVVLNELDWWIESRWDGFKTRRSFKSKSTKVISLRKKTKLTEVKIVRYADDFKLFCRNRESAEKIFKLVKIFLKERLKLEISPEKSKIVNLRKQSSDFLGLTIKTIKNRVKRTVRSHISKKAMKQIKEKIALEIKIIKRFPTREQTLKFNSVILGIQNYYRMATMVNIDLKKIGYVINKILMNRIGKYSWKRDETYKHRYKGYKFQVWTVAGVTIFTLQACRFKIPKMYSAKTKVKTKIKTEVKPIEMKNIESQESEKTRAMLRHARDSKCEVTGEYIKGKDNFYVHWIIPKEEGGTESLDNLMLLKNRI